MSNFPASKILGFQSCQLLRFIVKYMFENDLGTSYIYKNKVEGDLVECGVFMGGSAMMMCYAMNEFKKINGVSGIHLMGHNQEEAISEIIQLSKK